MRNVSDKSAEKIKINFMLNNSFFENRAVCEVMCKNMEELGRQRMTTKYDAEKMGLHAGKLKLQTHTQNM
jgi:hypothetical protein